MEVNQVNTLLPASVAAQMPPDVRAKLLAGQLASQQAAAPKAPYTSKAAGLVSALTGGLGGLVEGQAVNQAMAGQRQSAANMVALADAIRGSQTGGAPAGGAGGSPMPMAMPMGQGGAGSDAVASGAARNPSGYDARATEALIRASAVKHGIDPDAAVNVARHEGLNVYQGDRGSSFGPFQLHYGGVAKGGNAVGGMGDDFTKATGLDARDPSTVPQQIDFAMSQAAKGGWGPWHGAQAAKMGNWDGIGQNSKATATAQGDMPAPNAQPVSSMAGLPPGVTPAMFAASQNTATDGNALHRGDEMPAGSPPYVPGQIQPPPPPPIGPATSNAMLAKAVSDWKPDLGTTQPAVVPDPVLASAPDAPAAPSVLPPLKPPSGLGTAGAPVVPAPQGAAAPPPPAPQSDGSLRGDLLAAMQKSDPVGAGLAAGKDVALDPVVPDPVGSMMPPAPSSPNVALAGPQSDAAMGNDGAVTPPAAMPSPAALPDAAPLPPQGGQTPQVVADQAAAANTPTLDPEGTGAQNYDPGAGPSLRDTLVAAMNGGGGPAPAAPPPGPGPTPTAPPAPAASPISAPAATQTAGLSLPSADDPVGGLVGAPGTPATPPGPGGPASPPLPTLAGANVPPPSLDGGSSLPQTGPMPPTRPSMLASAIMGQGGSSLPATGPMPPARPSDQALGLNPDAPAPNAVATGPAPMQPEPGPMPSAPQPLGLAGDGGGDPNSARAFLTAEAIRNSGAPAAQSSPQALVAAMNGGPAPAPSAPLPSQGSTPPGGGSGLFGLGSGQGGGQSPGGTPAAAASPMGGGAPAAAPMSSGQGGAPQSGSYQQARAIAGQILSNPYSSPQAQEMAAKILMPQMQTITGADGKVYGFDPVTRQTQLLADVGAKFTPNESLYQGGHFTQAPAAPMDVAPGHTLTSFGANNQAIPQVHAAETPDFKPVPGTALTQDGHSGAFQAIPGGVNGTATLEAGGAKVPLSTNTGPNGVTAAPLVGGGTQGQPGQGGPLDAVKPLVTQANQMKAEGDAKTEEAKTQVTDLGKTAQTGIEARQKLQMLSELTGLSQKFDNGFGSRLGNWFHEHGVSTQTGSDQEAFNGLSGALAVDERPTGSGALRTAEVNAFKAQAGSPTMTPADRLAAIGRLNNVFQRDAQAGDLASNSNLPADQRTAMVHQLYALPYDKPVAITPADAAKMAPGTQFRDLQGNLRVVPGAQQ